MSFFERRRNQSSLLTLECAELSRESQAFLCPIWSNVEKFIKSASVFSLLLLFKLLIQKHWNAEGVWRYHCRSFPSTWTWQSSVSFSSAKWESEISTFSSPTTILLKMTTTWSNDKRSPHGSTPLSSSVSAIPLAVSCSHLIPVCFYNLIFLTLMTPRTFIVIHRNITPSVFDELHSLYHETLACPCTTVNIPYKTFVTNAIKSHPICASDFVSRAWIESFYLDEQRRIHDCRFPKDRFCSSEWRSRTSSVHLTVFFVVWIDCWSVSSVGRDPSSNRWPRSIVVSWSPFSCLTKRRWSRKWMGLFKWSKLPHRCRWSPLCVFSKWCIDPMRWCPIWAPIRSSGLVVILSAQISCSTFLLRLVKIRWAVAIVLSCIDRNSITPTGFSNERFTRPYFYSDYWPMDPFDRYNSNMSDMVSGFFAGCFPLDAALASSLDCLYPMTNVLECFLGIFLTLIG